MAENAFAFIPLGAIIQSLRVQDHNIVLNFDTQEQYDKHNFMCFGATIGRVANRISGAKLNNVNGKSYPLVANNGPNTLHGGEIGWNKRTWNGPTTVPTKDVPGLSNFQGTKSVQFVLVSEDGDQGFPGTVEVTVTYTAGTTADGALALAIEYEAKLLEGADETPINMTNHSYFDLSGIANSDGTVLTLSSDQYLPIDQDAIPTGPPVTFPDLDTSKPFTLTRDGPRLDHCFTKTSDPSSVPIDTRAEPLTRDLAAHHPKTGIHLEVYSTEPSYQIYTTDGMHVPAVGNISARESRAAFCCEPARWVNAVNVPEWKGMTMLKKGDTYGSRIVYKVWK